MRANDIFVTFAQTLALSTFVRGATWQGPRTFGLIVHKAVDLGNGPIEGADGEAMVCYVQNQVLTHDSQTDESHICTGSHPHRSADIDAGETGAVVSA